jgi:hypothetical protein
MIETIGLYFTPLASTKVAALIGLGLAYHVAIVYTNSDGKSFGVSSGPSNQMTRQTPDLALRAIMDSAWERPSGFGTLASDPHNDHPFKRGLPEDYYTQDDLGDAYPHALAAEGKDLSKQWRTIVNTYARVGQLHLTYSPITQNSNSMAGTALRASGLPIPFSSGTVFAPAVFTDLLATGR